MVNPVVHFEIIGQDTEHLRDFYYKLFGWESDTSSLVAPEVSEAGNYGFIQNTADAGKGIPGGIGGGKDYKAHSLFYVGVEDVNKALAKAEELGGQRVMGPVVRPGGGLSVGQFTDPEGNLIGVAGPQ